MGRLDQVRSEIARTSTAWRWCAVSILLAACDRPAVGNDDRAVSSADPRKEPGYVIDSALPIEEALRRFRVGLSEPKSLDGPRSRDELARRFMQAMRDRDSVALRGLAINRAEFAYLVYPESRLSKPPYRQPPEIGWMLLDAGTRAAIRKLIQRTARGLEPVRYRCPNEAEMEGALRITSGCVVLVREGTAERELRLFGRIIERDGRFKFAGLAGDL